MKFIGITQRVEQEKKYVEVRDCLDQRWCQLIEQVGVTPLPIPTKIKNVSNFVSSLNLKGIVLTGGNDLKGLPGSKNVSTDRDQIENELVRICSKLHLPLIGVCRGMQVLGDYYGSQIEAIEKHIAVRHKVYFKKSNFFFDRNELEVNSFHSYGIGQDGLAKDLVPFALDDDGRVEGFSHKALPQYGIMWHPERESIFRDCEIHFLKRVFSV